MSKPFCYVTAAGKAIRTEVLEQYASKNKSKQIAPDDFTEHYGDSGKGLVQPPYAPRVLLQLLDINTYHSRACKTKARDTAGLGWSLTPLNEKANENEIKELEEFLKSLPTPLTIMLNKLCMDMEAIGYGALELVRKNAKHGEKPVMLNHIPSHTIRIHKDNKRFMQQRGNKKAWFKTVELEHDVNFKTGQITDINAVAENDRATEVLWLTNYVPGNDSYGITDVIPAIGAIHGDISRRDYNIAFFDNFGVPAYAVFITGNFDPGEEDEEGKTELEKSIEGHFAELSGKPHSTLILSVPTRDGQGEVKIDFKALSVETKEASFRLYRQDNRDEVLAAHGTPPYRLGIAETGSLGGSTAKESTEIYKRSVIDPRQDVIEDMFNRYILPAFGVHNHVFELDEIDLQDEKHDMEMVEKMFKMAAMTPNQIIAYFGERFGVEQVDHPLMNAQYLDGVPITMDIPMTGQVEKALKNLQEKLLKVAVKNEH